MLNYLKKEALEKISWNHYPYDPLHNNSLVGFECWQYDGINDAIRGRNFRIVNIADGHIAKGSQENPANERLKRWLDRSDPYRAPEPPENSGSLKGGIRIIMCDRPNMMRGMTISRQAFEYIEESFSLHVATLPSFSNRQGSYSRFIARESNSHKTERIHIMIKAAQKIEVANYLLSLTYHAATGWTTAFICGYGVLRERQWDNVYGSIFHQLLHAISLSPELWSNPLFLPCILLGNFTMRAQRRSMRVDGDVIAMDAHFSVRQMNPHVKGPEMPPNWPRNVDIRMVVKELSSIAPQISFLTSSCNWLRGCASFLRDTGEALCNDSALERCSGSFSELQEIIAFLQSDIETLSSFFAMCRERIEFQTNLLYSIVGQQDSVLNRQDNILNLLIARSSKQDSISMSAFTFITALFLPGTFIATLFSMTMFDWQPGGGSDNSGTPTSPLSSSPASSGMYVSDKFWIFWAVAVPLTLVTMGGWFSWFKYADYRWRRELTQTLQSVKARGANEYFLSMLSEGTKSGKPDSLPLKAD